MKKQTKKEREKAIKKAILKKAESQGINTKELSKRLIVMCSLLLAVAWASDFTVNGPGQAQAQCSESQGVVTCR